MRRGLGVLVGTIACAFALSGVALSDSSSPTVDRGLPTANLNNAAGADRSNVAWSNGNDYVSGDSFSLGSTGQLWVITSIRTWSVAGTNGDTNFNLGDRYSDDTLYFGSGAIAPVESGTLSVGSSTDGNPNITHTRVTYANGDGYQTTSGAYAQLWQNDFTGLNLTVNGGQTYDFAVDGTPRDPSNHVWFNHASNAALAGSPQDGADGTWIAWAKSDLSTPNTCDSSGSGGVCNGGWDKSSDIDVQVFAHQVFAPAGPNDCKDGGWQTLVRDDGSSFRNQGACVSYAEHTNGVGNDDSHANEHNSGAPGKSGDSRGENHATTHGESQGKTHGESQGNTHGHGH